ncbi:MAG: HEAT repeat domain-containing protein [Bacillota bacterium]
MRYGIFSILVCLVLCTSPRLLSAQAPANVNELLARFPADADPVAGRQAISELVKLGPAAIKQVIAAVGTPGTAADTQARFALNGLVFHVSRPGAEAERMMFANAIIEVLATNPPPLTQTFLINMLQLAGKDECVPTLSKRLVDPELCEPATQALYCIKTPAATAALIQALPAVKESNRSTLIRALGVLRAVDAVDVILPYTNDQDANTRRMALDALANIGSPKAADSLAKAAEASAHLERAHATAMYLLFAQRLAELGNKPQCAAICRQLISARTASQENNVVCNALSTLTQAIGEDALADLLKAIDNDDHTIRAAALRLIQPMPGEAASAKLIAKLAEVDATRRAEIVNTLGYRADAQSRSAIAKALADNDKVVRRAAITAVARSAAPDAISALLTALNNCPADEAKAIQDVLARVPGEASLAASAAALPKASSSARVALLQILASRHAKAYVDPVLAAVSDQDAAVSRAAIKALGDLAEPKALPVLLDLLTTTQNATVQAEATRSVVQICQRIPDAQKRAEPVLNAMARATADARRLLIKSLSQLGGNDALQATIKEASNPDAATADAAVRTLADWRDASAAPALLKIAQTSETPNHRVLALRAYLRLLALPSDRPVADTIAMYQQALAAAQRPAEKGLALAGLSSIRTVESLKLVAAYLDDETLAAEAALAAVKIVAPRNESEQPLRGPEVTAVLRKVATTAKDPAIRAQATRYGEAAPKP